MLLGVAAVWLMLPRGRRGPRRRHRCLAAVALGLGALAACPRLGTGLADEPVSGARGRHGRLGRGGGHLPQSGLLRHLVRPVAVGRRRAVLRSPAPSSWPWPPWWSTPGRSWSRSSSCSCWPSPRERPPYDRVSWEAPISAVAGVVMVGLSLDDHWRLVLRSSPPGANHRPARSFPPAEAAMAVGVLAPQHVARLGRRTVRPALDRRRSGRRAAVGRRWSARP